MRGFAAALPLAWLLGACACGGKPPPAPQLDAWIHWAPTNAGRGTPVRFFFVADERQQAAQVLLAQVASRRLTSAELRNLADGVQPPKAEGIPVLLRGVVRRTDPAGRFDVLWTDRAVTVRQRTRCKYPGPSQERRAVVAYLPSSPAKVYVEQMTAYTGGLGPK